MYSGEQATASAAGAGEQSGNMIRASTYRLYPGTLRQAQFLARIAGANRYLWNWAIGLNQDRMRAWKEGRGEKPSIDFFRLGLEFTALRASSGHEWLRELPFGCVRYALKRYADAMREAVQGKRGFPRRKHAEDRNDSFTIPHAPQIRDGRLRVPRLGWLAIRRRGGDLYARGIAKQAVIERRPCGRWYAHVFWEVPDAELPDDGRRTGVDLNVGQATTSDGRKRTAPERARLEAQVKIYQRRVARRQRVPLLDADGEPRRKKNGDIIYTNSRRRERARVQLAKRRRKLANVRRNWHHHISSDLAGYGAVMIEDLQVRKMTASARGTRERPGRNARAKAGLNRAILSTGWAALARLLDYKARRVVRVPPQHTSQTCNRCGHVAAENRKTQAAFKCVACGHEANADVNAARNILRRGLSLMDAEGGSCGGWAFSSA